MSLIINSKLIRFLWWLLAPFLVATLLLTSLLMVLETKKSKTFEFKDEKISHMYSFPRFFIVSNRLQDRRNKIQKVEKLGNLILKACYVEKGREFVMFKEGQKSIFINLNEEYKGVKLVEITKNSAKFFQNGKYILLVLEKATETKKHNLAIDQKKASGDRYVSVQRAEIGKYKTNIKQALRDIRFYEIKKNNQFAGLKLSFIRRGTLFEKMGFKKGDIIESVDGQKINSLMDLLPYYSRLDNLTTLQIGFKRNEQKKEIIYEIN